MLDYSALAALSHRLDGLLQHDREKGTSRIHRDAFTDPEIFELEMKYIFEGNWVFLAHESQIPKANDYFTTYIGRQPIVITRDKEGQLHCLINSCSHRGAQLCRFKRANRSTFTCPFHGWSFSNTGKLLKVKDADGAGYPDQFNNSGSHDLKRVARFESYRGFLFGSLNPGVPPLIEYLGDAAKIIDLMVNQSEEGLEVLRGVSSYTYDGNWKLQAENGADGYHVSTVHWNYVATTGRRVQQRADDKIKAVNVGTWAKQKGSYWSFDNGHVLLWTYSSTPENRPLYNRRDDLVQKFGEKRADWMIGVFRNLCIYPNVFLMDQMSTQIRVFRPVAVNKTEVTIYCVAPKGESPEARARRIRQYEDFFNASGMATPDDLEEFRSCQIAYQARDLVWNDLSRGAKHRIEGQDEEAREMGIRPLSSGMRVEDEGLFVDQHTDWLHRMNAAVNQELAQAEPLRAAGE
ncbi:benzoate 1,2-dioxygenase large subunit [Bradyrhizobium sp.]